MTICDRERNLRRLERITDVFEGGKRWIQGAYENKINGIGTCYCLVGGVEVCCKTPNAEEEVKNILRLAIHKVDPIYSQNDLAEDVDIESWNDENGRTFADVRKVLKKAKQLAQKGETVNHD